MAVARVYANVPARLEVYGGGARAFQTLSFQTSDLGACDVFAAEASSVLAYRANDSTLEASVLIPRAMNSSVCVTDATGTFTTDLQIEAVAPFEPPSPPTPPPTLPPPPPLVVGTQYEAQVAEALALSTPLDAAQMQARLEAVAAGLGVNASALTVTLVPLAGLGRRLSDDGVDVGVAAPLNTSACPDDGNASLATYSLATADRATWQLFVDAVGAGISTEDPPGGAVCAPIALTSVLTIYPSPSPPPGIVEQLDEQDWWVLLVVGFGLAFFFCTVGVGVYCAYYVPHLSADGKRRGNSKQLLSYGWFNAPAGGGHSELETVLLREGQRAQRHERELRVREAPWARQQSFAGVREAMERHRS